MFGSRRQETGMRQMRLVLDILRVHPYFAPQPHRFFNTKKGPSNKRAFVWRLEAISIEYGQAHLAGERAKAVSGRIGPFFHHFGTILRYFNH